MAMDGLVYFEILKKCKTNAHIRSVGLALRMFLGSSCVYLSVARHPIEHAHTYKYPWLCRHDPMLFLALCKAHSLPTPADEYLASFALQFTKLSLFSTKPHPTPNSQTTYHLYREH